MKMEGGMTEAELESYQSFAKAAMEGHCFYRAYPRLAPPHLTRQLYFLSCSLGYSAA
jgi:hypothetical protein